MKDNLMLWAWWAWEPIYFHRLAGNVPGAKDISPDKLGEWYENVHSEETIAYMSRLGINCAVTHFYKGFGLEFEKKEMLRTAEFVRTCHKYGIKVFGYTQYGSIFWESFIKEVPEAVDWFQLDEKMTPRTWWGKEYRRIPCINKKEHFDYLQKCIKYGITETGLDGLHFDNFYSRPCYCGECRKKFREYLAANSLPDAENAEIPPEESLKGSSFSPLVNAWISFRQDLMNSLMREIKSYAKSLKSDIMLLYNPMLLHVDNRRAVRSVDMWDIGSNAQFVWAEGGNFPGIRKNCLVHQVNYFKISEATGSRVLSTTWKDDVEGLGLPESPEEISLNMAESAAFGAEPGTNWLLRPTVSGKFRGMEKKPLVDEMQKYFHFIKDNQNLYVNSFSCADTAVYLSKSARYHNFQAAYQKFLTIQQMLIQKHFPFDILFTEQGDKIFNYSTLIIPDTEYLSPDEKGMIKSFLDKGGKLMLIGNGDIEFSQRPERISIYLPRADWTGAIGDYTTYISLPPDASEFAGELEKLIGKDWVFKLYAPDTLVCEFRRAASGEYLLHLLNYKNTEKLNGTTVEFNFDCLKLKNCVDFLNPDIQGKKVLTASVSENIYNIPEFQTYGVLILEEENANA